jgi:hypothetical protein
MATAPAYVAPRIGANGHPLTPEQERIVALPPTTTRKWMAFAGCAKTTTSIEYAHAHPEAALYLAFNTSIAAEAKGKFPAHVHTQTAHGYAYSRLGVQRHADRLLRSSLKPEHLTAFSEQIRVVSNMTEIAVKRAIIRALNTFLISGDMEFGLGHMGSFPMALRQACLRMTKSIVDTLLDFENSECHFTHDIYLKAFQLRGSIEPKFKYMILDEAQDLNPVLIAIAKQSKLPLIVVGDAWQSIYRFRGAEQAMDHFEGETLTLSQSFRFGPKVASVANYLLRQSMNRPGHPLQGNPAKKTVVRAYEGSIQGRATILARTNLRLFESLVQTKVPFHVVGGVKDMIDLVEAGYHLWCRSTGRPAVGKAPINQTVQKFRTWDELVESAELDEDPELVRLVKIVDTYEASVPTVLADLRSRSRDNERDARIIVSTAHKAKGREWDNVVLLEDFPTPSQLRAMFNKKRITSVEYDQEINLLYVAATRAIGMLLISSPLFDEIAAGTGITRFG